MRRSLLTRGSTKNNAVRFSSDCGPLGARAGCGRGTPHLASRIIWRHVMQKPKFYIEIFSSAPGVKGSYGSRVRSRNGEVVYSMTSQGYVSRGVARRTVQSFVGYISKNKLRVFDETYKK